MEETITIKSSTQKTSRNGKSYLYVESTTGKYSCWNPQIYSKLVPGAKLVVSIEENNGYKSILGINQDLGISVVTGNLYSTDKFQEQRDNKNASMLLSYAKDIVVALIETKKANDLDVPKLLEETAKTVANAYKTISKELEKEEVQLDEHPI